MKTPHGCGEERPRRKTFRLSQAKIKRAMRVLGTDTENETIEKALDLVVFQHDLVEGVRAMRGANLEAVFSCDTPPSPGG